MRDFKHYIYSNSFVGAQSLYNAYFGEGSGPILLHYVYCSTPTFSLLNCNINSYYYYYKYYAYNNHNNDVGVRCQRELIVILK